MQRSEVEKTNVIFPGGYKLANVYIFSQHEYTWKSPNEETKMKWLIIDNTYSIVKDVTILNQVSIGGSIRRIAFRAKFDSNIWER